MAISYDMLSLDSETSNPRLERQLSQILQSATLVGLGGTQEVEARRSGVGDQLGLHKLYLKKIGRSRHLAKLLSSKGT